MSLRLRLSFLMILAIGIVMIAMPATAQYDCEGLNADDCTLWADAQTATNEIDSSTFTLDMNLRIEETTADESISFQVQSEGAYAFDEGRYATDILTIIQSLSADVSVLFNISELELDAPILLRDLEELTEPFSLELNLVDGIGTINLSKFLEPEDIETDWYGIDVGAIWQLVESVGELETDGLFEMNNQDLNLVGFGNGGIIPTTTERLADSTSNGQDVAVLQTTYNYNDIVGSTFSTIFLETLIFTFWETALEGLDFRSSQIDQITQETLDLFPYMSTTIERTIGLEDNYIHNIALSFELTPPAYQVRDLLMNFDAGNSIVYYGFEVFFDMTFTRGQINDAITIAIPEDSTIIPFFELFSILDDSDL